MRVVGPVQGEAPGHRDADRPGLGEAREVGEVVRVGADEDVDAAEREHLPVGHRGQPAVLGQQRRGPGEHRPADGVQGRVDALGHQFPYGRAEAVLVGDRFGAERPDLLGGVRPGGADDAGAEVDADPDRHRADRARRAVHQQGLAAPDPQPPAERLESGEAGEREAGGGQEAEVAGFVGEGADRAGDVLGAGALAEPVLAGVADDLVADRVLVDRPAALHDDAGDVPAGDHREGGVQERGEQAGAAGQVDRVDGGGDHLDEDGVGRQFRIGQIAVLQHLRAAEGAVADPLHGLPPGRVGRVPLLRGSAAARRGATGRGAGRGEAIRITSGSASGRHTDWSASWGATLHRTTQEP